MKKLMIVIAAMFAMAAYADDAAPANGAPMGDHPAEHHDHHKKMEHKDKKEKKHHHHEKKDEAGAPAAQ